MARRITQERFNVFSIGSRLSRVSDISEELSCWADLDENLIGLVTRDKIDDDFSWVMFARDRVGRFRAADLRVSISTQRRAEAELRLRISDATRHEDMAVLGIQGDEPNAPYDILSVAPGTSTDELHPYFKELIDRPSRAPARKIFSELGPWLAPSDPHFVREFQRHHFDQRLWELYLWASFREMRFDVDQLDHPDFFCRSSKAAFSVEATTTAPSTSGVLAVREKPTTPKERQEYINGYAAIKFASSLTSKVAKVDAGGLHYWEQPEVKDLPFLIAIADFHQSATENEPASLTYTQSALWQYLYGHRVQLDLSNDEPLVVTETVSAHTYGPKVIPSGFFDQPENSHIAGVLFSNAGTLAKFDRMGVRAGFGAKDHKYIRIGDRYDPTPGAIVGLPFKTDVEDAEYSENWSDELQLFHNPNAAVPFPPWWMPEVTHHFWENGDLHTYGPPGRILGSFTMILSPKD